MIFQFGGNYADLESSLCSVWERDMFPGSSSLEFIVMLGHPEARQPPISSSSSAEELGMFQVHNQGVAPFLGAVFLEKE